MCAVKWKINWKLIQTFCPKSSQEMNHGVMGTIRRQSNNQINGKVHHPRDQKRRGKSNQKWKPCWSASLTSKGSFTLNSYHKVRLLTSCFTLKCSSDCMMLCEENALNCGDQASGFCIRTVLPPTQLWVCISFSWKTGWQWLCTPLLPGPGTLRCFLVSKNEEGPERKAFPECREGEGKKQQRHWRLSLCKSSRTVLNNGKSGGIRVLILKESILRVIKFWKCSEKYTIKKKKFSLFLGPPSYMSLLITLNKYNSVWCNYGTWTSYIVPPAVTCTRF